MRDSRKWNPWIATTLGFALSFLLLGFSSLQSEGSSLRPLDSRELVGLLLQLFGPPLFLLLIAAFRNRSID